MGAIGMAECQRCGAHVTSRFKRVFAGDDKEVHGCLGCMTHRAIIGGAATHRTEGADHTPVQIGERVQDQASDEHEYDDDPDDE